MLTSQSRAVRSSLPVRTTLGFRGWKATARTAWEWTRPGPCCRRVLTSQSRATRSRHPVRKNLPSGLNATLVTPSGCANKPCKGRAVSASQSRAVLSPLPVSKVFPSGLKATQCASRVSLGDLAASSPVATFQSRTTPSQPAVATFRPSGLKAAAHTSLGWEKTSSGGLPAGFRQRRAR